ncbi:MAG: hypothetical protein HFJ10_09425 [Lachnospiraceae bacterium]|nr:hypothetical protein [Lachnospiraceae bacterium]
MGAVISIDLGTSGCRSAVYNDSLQMLCSATREYPLIVHSDTWIEQDANLWWDSVIATVKEALAAYPLPGEEIQAISISAQSISFVPIDEKGKTLHHAISWLDGRGEEEIKELERKYSAEELYNRTGKRLSPAYTFSKMLWFKKHKKKIYEKAWKILLPLDFIQYRLSGKCVCDHTIAGGTMFYDIVNQTWDRKLLEENGLSVDKLPEIAWAGTVVGTLRSEVAQELGLTQRVLVVNGAQDQKCAALGAGASHEIAAISLGTGCCISQISDKPFQDPAMRIPFFSYVYKNTWDLEGVINTAGSAYSWFQRELGGGKSFQELNAEAEEVDCPNTVQFYPNLAGGFSPCWEEGMGVFSGLSLMSTRGHLTRAIFEGIAYNIRGNLDVMGEICGGAKKLHVFGGGSKSDLWCQIIADITNTKVVTCASSDTALAGAAKLAFMPLKDSMPDSLPFTKEFIPHVESVRQYESSYQKYQQMRKHIFADK